MKNNSDKKILIVDDEADMRMALETTLKREGFQITSAENGREALDRLDLEPFDLVVSDVKMPQMSGLELLKEVKKKSPRTQVIMMTAYEIIDNAVDAMKAGAFDFLIKPFQADILVSAVNRSLRYNATPVSRAEISATPAPASAGPGRHIITCNKEMLALIQFAENIAYSKSTVLIMGETGTGKELFARYIHQSSPRADKPFLAVNCAALPENLLESEMFGHEKGSFTGATHRKEGKFELADRGTLLLDEVTEMSLPLQAKLLRVLQEHEIDKVGGREPIPVDVRVIATTNASVKQRVQDNEFREDLYYRLNVIPIRLIPLRERNEDIPALAQYFMERHALENGKSIKSIAPETLVLLQKYRWPGNVRELGNIMERAVLLCREDTLTPSHLFFDEEDLHSRSAESNDSETFPKLSGTIYDMEKELILQTLQELNGNRTKAAENLGISIRTLRNKLAEYQKKG
ncbi:MAG: sigma-54-dependent Fis family transcriptional regulator [Nitrospinae bacterium CG11_big_fil_rev_8_21_14_0_20_56_8]|nr:MAG: sigma-54-dependent Fis family transcriptional regulator [Nitrospinae bacterium CG11_big_fil_rev_8_21_14_0_20_56_8]